MGENTGTTTGAAERTWPPGLSEGAVRLLNDDGEGVPKLSAETAAVYRKTQREDPLPGRLSDLLALAVREARTLPGRYTPESGFWMRQLWDVAEDGTRVPGPAYVCLGGALLAKRTGYAREDAGEGQMGRDHLALLAVARAAAGWWPAAFEYARAHVLAGFAEPVPETDDGGEEERRRGRIEFDALRQAEADVDAFDDARLRKAGGEIWKVPPGVSALAEPEEPDFTDHAGLEKVCADIETQLPALRALEDEFEAFLKTRGRPERMRKPAPGGPEPRQQGNGR